MLNDMDFFKGELMTLDLLEKLESKIQNAVDTIALLQMEVDELKGDNQGLLQKNDQLQQENIKLNEEHQLWQSRLSALVGKIEKAEDTM
jgi:cell division protein ZapB